MSQDLLDNSENKHREHFKVIADYKSRNEVNDRDSDILLVIFNEHSQQLYYLSQHSIEQIFSLTGQLIVIFSQ